MARFPSTAARLGLALPLAAALGCAGATIVATHEPMHAVGGEAVTFKGSATGKVKKIELAYERYALSTASDGSHVQTLADAKTTVKTCDPGGTVSSLDCTHTMSSAFAAGSLITYYATVTGDQGTSTESYSFAAGDYPWPDDPIPIRLKGGTAEKLDVVFIPDTDLTLATFRSQLDEVIEDLYFKYEPIKFWRGLYNFYYSGRQGNYEELCKFTNPPNMADLEAVADTVAILHQTDLRDCRSGTRMSSEIDYDKTLLHETGHALFDMKDEYCCDSSYSQQACVPNLYSSLANCQNDAARVGLPASNCTQLASGTETKNFWRIDPSACPDCCIMGPGQHTSTSKFLGACAKRMDWRHAHCIKGECMSTDCP
jgi:hypothetical protein